MKILIETMQELNESNLSRTENHASKKRKMSERVVVAVKIQENDKKHHRSEGPPSDCWSWRKYGQKPIKGSPYPRFISLYFSYRLPQTQKIIISQETPMPNQFQYSQSPFNFSADHMIVDQEEDPFQERESLIYNEDSEPFSGGVFNEIIGKCLL
ncbi:hypothetical protein CDL12_19032 [Handroanthus impetiginosus]|uniref:WRKY domain-containing protein n=1 Tax=Handroanthus impetiginosus TaxID=429701 RepID=A0A2G9GT41_9LAMI|nr:hypothetical protein CDL12_19032 [Handroanthus impetiginosus]